VIRPRVLLFDEPLSNLDAKLRVQMRQEIRDLQRRLGITTVYVTHDQEEAMAVSDRIAVMHQGRVVQEGTAEDLYHRPVSQFVAQFVVDARELVNFYGILPDFLFGFARAGGQNTIGMVAGGSSLMRSNGFFLGEPSGLSQITALGILIEVLEFRRPRYLLVMALGFLVAYSGTGLVLLLLFLPLASLRDGSAGLSGLLVVMFALGLFAAGIFDLSAFLNRAGEFQDTRTSGFQRFVSPFWLADKQLNTVSVQALLLGSGPGTVKILADTWYAGGFAATWIKILYEYGIIGLFIFCCFLASCLRRSRCPGLVLAAIIFAYVFLQGIMTITIALCTLSGPELRRGRLDETSQHRSSLVAGPVAG